MKNYDSHVYLYAKHWYESSDPISDLKIIYGERNCIYADDVSINDICACLLALTQKHVQSERKFLEFMSDIAPENVWRVWKFNNEDYRKDYTYAKALISKCLSVLSLAQIDEIENGLDDPDYNILPKPKR